MIEDPVRNALLVRLLAEQGIRSAGAAARASELQAHIQRVLEASLPEPMRPRSITFLPALPLSRNGKIDLAALPAPDAGEGRTLIAPRTPTEAELLALWKTALGRQDLGVTDDFFLSGGDSVRATQLARAVNQHFRTELPIALIFTSPTIAQLAESIDLVRELSDPELDEMGLEMPIAELAGEVTLDDAIQPTGAALPPADWRSILLTGGTGYFGSHLLVSLLAHTRATIFCLVRAPTDQAALERLLAAVRRYSPEAAIDARRVAAVAGDFASPNLGLGDERYLALAARIDAVLHAGAIVNFAYPLESLRATNIQGAQEVLRFATTTRTKAVHFVSTINIFSSTHLLNDQRMLEGQSLTELPTVIGGYAQSRWAAEGIARLARERGLPLSIYRPSIIGGHSRTGISNENDAVARLFKGCIQLGCVPKLSARLNIVTADYASDALTALALEPANLGGTFHLVNPRPSLFTELFEGLRAHGYALETVPYRDWHERVESAGLENALYPLLPIIAHLGVSEAIGIRSPHFDDSQARAALASSGLSCPPIDRALIASFLDAMIARGVVAPAVGPG